MMKKTIYFISVLIAVFITACSKPAQDNQRILFTTILPQKDFVRHIAGNRFEVHALAGAGQNPHSYTPTPDQMKKLSKASAYFSIGMEVEDGVLPKIKKTMPKLPIVDLRKDIEFREMTEAHHHEDEDHHNDAHDAGHDESCDGHHDGKDPHIWLSPLLVKKMAVTIKKALIEIDPQGKQVYEKNFKTFTLKLDSLDEYIRTTLKPVKGTELFVFHPAFGYFADEYGLIQKPVETGGKEPSARDLAKLIKEAREHKPKVIFVQPQYTVKSAEALARQIGCAVVPINPLPENYFKEMHDMSSKVREGLHHNE